jgi:drug/metabolite transporter (DMT)-like permease
MLRVLLSMLFAAFLLMIVLGRYSPDVATSNSAMWSVALVGMSAIIYSSLNSFNALRHSMGHPPRLVYVGLLFSFLPLMVAAYAIAVWQYSPTHLSPFQLIAILFGGLAAIIDLGLFSWLLFGQARDSNRIGKRPA